MGSGQNGSTTKKGCFGLGRNRFRSEQVWVEVGPGQNEFRVGLVKMPLKIERLYIKWQFYRVETGRVDSG
ncbi:hypothetical protein Hanom_Chr12g01067721 [Helianthus anomalus]